MIPAPDAPCRWCNRQFDEHAIARSEGAPVPRVPCLGLRSHYLPRGEPIAPPLSDADLERIAAEHDTEPPEAADTERPPPT